MRTLYRHVHILTHMCVYIYITGYHYANVAVHVHVYIHIIDIKTYADRYPLYAFMCTYTYMCRYSSDKDLLKRLLGIFSGPCVYACMYVHVCVYIYIYIYIYIYGSVVKTEEQYHSAAYIHSVDYVHPYTRTCMHVKITIKCGPVLAHAKMQGGSSDSAHTCIHTCIHAYIHT
jgi:hypothetical protein